MAIYILMVTLATFTVSFSVSAEGIKFLQELFDTPDHRTAGVLLIGAVVGFYLCSHLITRIVTRRRHSVSDYIYPMDLPGSESRLHEAHQQSLVADGSEPTSSQNESTPGFRIRTSELSPHTPGNH